MTYSHVFVGVATFFEYTSLVIHALVSLLCCYYYVAKTISLSISIPYLCECIKKKRVTFILVKTYEARIWTQTPHM